MHIPRSLRLAIFAAALPAAGFSATYYVSPTGSDSNPGTQSLPWATARKAAQTLVAGDTALFENGTYNETLTTNFLNAGTASARITLAARNKHGAKLNYNNLGNQAKMSPNKDYITIRDFEITQPVRGTDTNDRLVQISGNYIEIIGNKIHFGYEEGIKCNGNDNMGWGNVLVEGNIIYDFEHEGIDFNRAYSSTIRFNEIYQVNRVAMMLKSGCRSLRVYGNHIHSPSASGDQAIALGGSTDAAYAYDAYGWEAYNSYAWSNLIEGPWYMALQMRGAKDCGFFNNVVIGANQAFGAVMGGKDSGVVGEDRWYWTATGPLTPGQPLPPDSEITGMPMNQNVWFKNNIVVAGTNANAYATQFGANSLLGGSSTLTLNYNLYYGFGTNGTARLVYPGSLDKGLEANGTYTLDPLFVTNYSNLHLQSGSPAIDSGTAITATGFFGEAVDVSRDYDNAIRTGTWDKGAYTYTVSSGVTLPYTDTFEDGTVTPWVALSGTWSTATDGTKVLTQTTASSDAVAMVGSGWTDQFVQARVKPVSFNGTDRHVAVYARFTDMNNHYYVTLRSSNVIELKKKVGGVVTTLDSKSYTVTTGTWYTVRLDVAGSSLVATINGVSELRANDSALASGGVALGMYSASASFDDVSIKPLGTLLYEDFEDSTANNFTTSGGTWSVVTDGTKVYKQASTTVATYYSIHNTSWTDQIVQTDVKVLSFNGTDRSVGIYARWTDTNNHYFMVIRNSNLLQIRKRVGGTYSTLVQVPMTVSAGQLYTLRLEVIGSSLKAYVNGTKQAEAYDSQFASGKIAVGTYAASAEFGDVLVTGP